LAAINRHYKKSMDEFYRFLNGDIEIDDFEKYIYHDKDLEKTIDHDDYLELISFDFKEKHSNDRLKKFILQSIIDQGQFETWRLKNALQKFIGEPESCDDNLKQLYDFYCGRLQDNGERIFEFKFLANLGLNMLYWIDEGYMKTVYKENWEKEYIKARKDNFYYHSQLKPFAVEILNAILNDKIKIQEDGSYKIDNELRIKLETDDIYKIEHREK
ncbi:MAG: hypothetical protein JXQ87_19005, partial [Bacteroidia bacterium]